MMVDVVVVVIILFCCFYRRIAERGRWFLLLLLLYSLCFERFFVLCFCKCVFSCVWRSCSISDATGANACKIQNTTCTQHTKLWNEKLKWFGSHVYFRCIFLMLVFVSLVLGKNARADTTSTLNVETTEDEWIKQNERPLRQIIYIHCST